jgi:apyrase
VGGNAANEAPKGYVREIKAASATYRTYVHSFKGYGIVAVRPKIFSVGKNRDGSHPCLPNAFADSCEKDCYGLEPGETYAAIGSNDGSDFERCLLATKQALEGEGKCANEPCSFAGAWTTPRKTPLFVMSFIVERAIQGGAAPPPKKPSDIATITPRDVKKAASRACSTPAAELEERFPVAKRDDVDVNYLCLDLTYVYALLTLGYGAGDDETIHMLDKIRYKRQDVEASWALGDGIAVLGAASARVAA